MDDIAAKLSTFKSQYSLVDSKTDTRFRSVGKNDFARKILLVDNSENVIAKIESFGNKQISINIEKGFCRKLASELPKNTDPVQINENFAAELLKLIQEDIASIKGALYDDDSFVKTYRSKLGLGAFDVKLKEVIGNYSVVCTPEGLVAEATLDTIAKNLAVLKNRYILLDSKSKPDLFNLKGGSRPLARRILIVDISEHIKVDIQATEDYKDLEMSVFKFDKNLK